jgi:hypothetical protein
MFRAFLAHHQESLDCIGNHWYKKLSASLVGVASGGQSEGDTVLHSTS